MSFKSTRGQFAKVAIGTPDLSKLTLSQFTSTGVLTNPGISIFGGQLPTGVLRAGVSIGPPLAIPGVTLPFSLEVTGISNHFGIVNVFGVVNRFGLMTALGGSLKNGFSFKNALDLKNAIDIGNSVAIINGPLTCNGPVTAPDVTIAGTCKAAVGVFAAVAAPFKKFDIPHPSKPGKRLVHTCLEGPEIGVYYRGVLDGENIIPFPEFWDKLVDLNTITVNLTPKDEYQELYYRIVEDGIRVSNNKGSKVKCSYTLYAERCDVDKLKIEYDEVEE